MFVIPHILQSNMFKCVKHFTVRNQHATLALLYVAYIDVASVRVESIHRVSVDRLQWDVVVLARVVAVCHDLS